MNVDYCVYIISYFNIRNKDYQTYSKFVTPNVTVITRKIIKE